jgi:hypothetical protein
MVEVANPVTDQARLLLRFILVPMAALLCGWLGMGAGSALTYKLAAWADHDIAHFKDMLILAMLVHMALFAMLGAFAVLAFTGAGTRARAVMRWSAAFAIFAGAALLVTSYPWPKDSGHPVVNYELRIPASLPEPLPGDGGYDLTIWKEKMGQGVYIEQVRRTGDRPEIKGAFVLYKEKPAPTMSLRLRGMEGHWRVPYDGNAKLEKEFGAWQKIEFIPTPREGVPPLPPGDYEIRYRVHHYM